MSKNIRVVVVDDHKQMLENVYMMLDAEPGIDVVGSATSGIDGLDLAFEHKPDIFLTDINMPGVDGLTVSQDITRDLPNTRVILMSVEDIMAHQLGSIWVGVSAFLIKPFSHTELITTVKKVFADLKEQS